MGQRAKSVRMHWECESWRQAAGHAGRDGRGGRPGRPRGDVPPRPPAAPAAGKSFKQNNSPVRLAGQ